MQRTALSRVPLASPTASLTRAIDVLPRHRVYFFLGIYLIAHVGYLLALLVGPPVYHRDFVNFDAMNPTLPAHKVNIRAGNFNFLNDFVTLDLLLLRDSDQSPAQHELGTSLVVKGHKGSRIETLYAQNPAQVWLTFDRDSGVSKKIRLFSRAVVDFIGLDMEVILKFPERLALSGVFIVSYIDSSHTILELLVRLIFFFVAVTVLVYMIPMKKSTSPFQLRILTFLVGLIVIASNPLIILSYFTDSIFLPLVDAAAGLALVLGVSAGLLLICEASHGKDVPIATAWPFAIAGAMYFLNSFLSQVFGATAANSAFMQLLSYARSIVAAGCFLRVVVSLVAFQSEIKFEKTVMVALASVSFAVGLVCELFLVAEPLIASSHEVQIFTFASVSTFVLFLVKLYWPVDASQFVDPDAGDDQE
jgi:hypothetical protein